MFSILSKVVGGLFSNAGGGSWLGRILGVAGVGEATNTVDVIGADITGLPWWATAIMVFFWLRSEKQDFDLAGLVNLMSKKAPETDTTS